MSTLKETMNKRCNVECARFIAALMIMAHHIYITGVGGQPFFEAWVWVEFFLLVTGYFTAKHYDNTSAANPSKDAFIYTIKKIMPLFPYALTVTVLAWITQGIVGLIYWGWTWKSFVTGFTKDFVFDLLLITDSVSDPLVVPLWYVSALIMMFPFLCLIAQIRNRYTRVLICSVSPLIYFEWTAVSGERAFPHNLLRVLAGMMLGMLLYELSVIFKEQIQKIPKLIITVIELAAFALPVIGCFGEFTEAGITTSRMYLLCFFVSLLFCLPGFSYTAGIRGKVFDYLGRLSMPVFIVNWYVGTVVDVFGDNGDWGFGTRITVFYIATLVISMLLMFIIDHLRGWSRLRKKEIILID